MMTAKRVFSFVMLVAICVACTACYYSSSDFKADRSFVKRVVKVGYFCKIESYTSADIKFVQGKKSSVRIEGTKSLVDNLDVRQKGETLVITTKGRGIRFVGQSRLTVYVSSPDITSVYLKGSGYFVAQGNIDTDALDVELSGSGDVDLRNVLCDNISLRLRGSGDVKALSVDCAAANIELLGSGDLEVKTLKARKAVAALRGSGDLDATLIGVADVQASLLGSGDLDLNFVNCGNANIDLRGSGDIELKGTLRTLNTNKKGSGDIDRSELRLAR